MRLYLYIFILSIAFFSCQKEALNKVDVSDVSVNFSTQRFDVDFYTTSSKTLQTTKQKYPLLFPKQTPDSIWLAKINDKDEQELFLETQKVYNDVSELNTQLSKLFKHVKYYNPQFKAPDVITMLTNIDYENRIVYTDSILLISLDAYLGKEHPFYSDFPAYIKENNTKSHIVVDVANAIIDKQFLPNTQRTFMSKILHEGKKGYLLNLYLPETSLKEKTGYTADKLQWAEANEEQIWRYFIEHKLLYSTDMSLNKRFIDNAPFSKFYLAQDNLSPGKIGSWIGGKIVSSYMTFNTVSLQELIALDEEELFKKSKYKPKK